MVNLHISNKYLGEGSTAGNLSFFNLLNTAPN